MASFYPCFQMPGIADAARGPAVLPAHTGVHGHTIGGQPTVGGAVAAPQPPFSARVRAARRPDHADAFAEPAHRRTLADGQDAHPGPAAHQRRVDGQQPAGFQCRTEARRRFGTVGRIASDGRDFVAEAALELQGVRGGVGRGGTFARSAVRLFDVGRLAQSSC